MIKVKIILDEEKILNENKYSLKKIWGTIDFVYEKAGLICEENGTYRGNGSETDFASHALIIEAFSKETWFMDNIKEWLWYNSDPCYSDNENEYSVADILSPILKLHK